ncbi:hypothetical protein BDV28DRAFT_154236 [Aspergillus coremiiformis]|uniref:Xylanolytic transcriptional activator regulatory domain-containing protein n=1 Tax=Aspergillus coremiiformis TaxID=138285 RepID=A0A5N6ZIZ0_9EURO|nr:hypothetical protein BDV28DRAFT_154236 [Aspergillus coremiiformis]
MALGCLFEGRGEGAREAYVSEGLADLQDCNDLVTLQAILYMNIFLLYTARASSCFSALSYTFSLALRMKYHQILDTDNVIIREEKRHVFWTTRHLLACVSIMGGLPMPIGVDDLDLEYPGIEEGTGIYSTEQLSESLHETVRWSPTIASVACFRLHNILGHVTKRLYPSKGVKKTNDRGPLRHLVSMDTVRELEGELQSWLASLPPGYRLGQEMHPLHIERAKYELCMSYAHAQIYLYRPFLHYLVSSPTDGIWASDGFPEYASACVDASRNIIRLAQDMHNRGLFRGVQWDISNMILASSLTMLYIILSRKGSPVEEMALTELRTAQNLITLLEPYSMLARRTSIAVKLLTSTILPDETSGTSPPNTVHSPFIQVSSLAEDLYTTALAEKTFGFISKANEPGHQVMPSGVRQSASGPVRTATERESTDDSSRRLFQIAGRGISSHDATAHTEAQTSDASTSIPMLSGQRICNTPSTSGGITNGNPLSPTFPQVYRMDGNDYGYMIDGTGPIDFSDMIGDLFTSEGVL